MSRLVMVYIHPRGNAKPSEHAHMQESKKIAIKSQHTDGEPNGRSHGARGISVSVCHAVVYSSGDLCHAAVYFS